MAIRSNIHSVPRATDAGLPPSRHPFMVEAIADAWLARYRGDGRDIKARSIPEAGPYRGSFAGKRCDRDLFYALLKEMVPPPQPGGWASAEAYDEAWQEWTDQFAESNPPGPAEYWTWWLGQLVHEALQPILLEMFPGAAEKSHDLRAIGVPGSSHSDVELVAPFTPNPDDEPVPTMVEIKSTNGYSYKMQATSFQGPPEGPRYGAVMQAVMSAAAEGIDRIVIILASLEKVSPNMAWSTDSEAGRFMSEWHFSVEEMRPQLEAEIERILAIIKWAESWLNDQTIALPPRMLHDPEYPDGAIVQAPSLGQKAPWTVVDEAGNVKASGTYWGCGYCSQKDRCNKDGA